MLNAGLRRLDDYLVAKKGSDEGENMYRGAIELLYTYRCAGTKNSLCGPNE